jgi:carbon storage regulator
MIGDGIEVRVLRIGSEGVRLGVTAPAAVAVHRREIYDQICAENRTAAAAAIATQALAGHLQRLASLSTPSSEGQRDGERIAAPSTSGFPPEEGGR